MYYVNPVIKDFLRTNQPEDRGSYIRLDQNENPEGVIFFIAFLKSHFGTPSGFSF